MGSDHPQTLTDKTVALCWSVSQDYYAEQLHHRGAKTVAITGKSNCRRLPVPTNPGHEVCPAVQGTRLNDTIHWPLDINAAGVRLRR